MIDLRQPISKAMAKRGQWDTSSFVAALHAVASSIENARIDWEQGDEEWGRVLKADGQVAALVCVRVPFGFLCAPEMDSSHLSPELTWVCVEDIEEPAFTVDKSLLEAVFGRELSENVNYGALSAQDVWWATV